MMMRGLGKLATGGRLLHWIALLSAVSAFLHCRASTARASEVA